MAAGTAPLRCTEQKASRGWCSCQTLAAPRPSWGLLGASWLWGCAMHSLNMQRTMCDCAQSARPLHSFLVFTKSGPRCNPGVPTSLWPLLDSTHCVLHAASRQAPRPLPPPILPHHTPIRCQHTAGQQANDVTGAHRDWFQLQGLVPAGAVCHITHRCNPGLHELPGFRYPLACACNDMCTTEGSS